MEFRGLQFPSFTTQILKSAKDVLGRVPKTHGLLKTNLPAFPSLPLESASRMFLKASMLFKADSHGVFAHHMDTLLSLLLLTPLFAYISAVIKRFFILWLHLPFVSVPHLSLPK